MRKGRFGSLLFGLLMAFSTSFGIGRSAFVAGGETKVENISLVEAGGAVCYNDSTKVTYTNLKTALDNATSGQYVYMYIGVQYDCRETITIKSGVHLVLPFVGKAFDTTVTGKNISDTPMYRLDSADNRNNYGNALGDLNATNVAKYRSVLLNMRDGKDIVVNGFLHLGGVHSTSGNNGYYSEINLGSGSSIICNNGSTFDCYGYVKEDSSDYRNPTNSTSGSIENEEDASRFLQINTGATLVTYLAMYDAPEAGGLTTLVNANQCPFWEYDFPALQTYVDVSAGSTVKAYALLVGPNSLTIDKEVTVATNDTSKEALFYLTSGRLTLEYSTATPLYSSRNLNARKTLFAIKGEVSVGYLYVKEGNAIASLELDTRNCFLPIGCRLDVHVANSGHFVTDKKLKFLAGSSLSIEASGRFTINNEVIFHKSDSLLTDRTVGIYYRVTASTVIDDATLVCNGTIDFNTDGKSLGAIGAFVQQRNIDDTAVFDLTNLGADSKLTVSDVEGTSDTTVIVTSSGQFETEIGQFTAGAPYTSSHNGDSFYWVGNIVSTYDITVTIASGVTNGVVQYTIKSSENADGSGAVDTTLVDATAAGTTSIPRGRYLVISLVRGAGLVIKDASGNTLSTDANAILLVNKNMEIVITPSETYQIDMKNALIDGASSNGRGHVTFEIFEAKEAAGTYYKVDSGKIEFTTRICAGSYFYMVRTFDSGIYNYYQNADAEITKTPSGGSTPASWNLKSTGTSPKYLADANYVFQTYWTFGASGGGGCISADTMVLMGDGSTKRAIDVRAGDLLMTVNHETGEFEAAPVVFNDDYDKEAAIYNVIHLEFSNGSRVEVIFEHGFFDLETMRYEYITEENYRSFLGHRFVTVNENDGVYSKGEAILTNATLSTEKIQLCSPVTYKNLDLVTEGMLSMPGGIEGIFNIFEYDSNLAFDEEKKQRDIETYGLFDYSHFEDRIPYEFYEAFNGQYLKVAIGKGMLTEEMIDRYIARYLPVVSDQSSGA